MGIGAQIRKMRKEIGLTLEETARKAGMQASNLSDIEKDKRDIRTETLERIAKALGCRPSDFYDVIYETDEEITKGLRDLIKDVKTCKLMSIAEQEIKWMRSIRFRPNQHPTKQDYIDLLFLYRNIE